jgi:hypothetical protein
MGIEFEKLPAKEHRVSDGTSPAVSAADVGVSSFAHVTEIDC